jgi:hypothetical protein
MRARWLAAAVAAVALTVRATRSRHRRSLHPAGRSFTGDLHITAADPPIGATLLDQTASYPVTLRVSKAAGTPGSLPDVRGLAIRVHLPGRDFDLLLDSTGRRVRHFPVPRRSFNTPYGTITSYRAGSSSRGRAPDRGRRTGRPGGTGRGEKVYLLAEPDRRHGLILWAGDQTVGRVTIGRPLPPSEDAALAFDPVRNSLPDLHPSGFLHAARAFAYPWSQRWRRAAPAPQNPAAVRRAGAHR